MTAEIHQMAASDALRLETTRLGQVASDPAQSFLWFWNSPKSLVVPRKLAVKPNFALACSEMNKAGWPVDIRATGGDVTPMGPGIVCVSIVYARAPGGPVEIASEYNKLCAPIERVLGNGASRGWMQGAFCDGEYNVQWRDKKFAGTAMRFRPCRSDKSRYAILSHALMLMRPPETETIKALNRFLELMGEDREIEVAAHTGLPSGVSEERFLTELDAAYRAEYRLR